MKIQPKVLFKPIVHCKSTKDFWQMLLPLSFASLIAMASQDAFGQSAAISVTNGNNSYLYQDAKVLTLNGITDTDLANTRNKAMWVAAKEKDDASISLSITTNLNFVGDLCIGTSNGGGANAGYSAACAWSVNGDKKYQGTLTLGSSAAMQKSALIIAKTTIINSGSALILQNGININLNEIILNGTKESPALLVIGNNYDPQKLNPGAAPGVIGMAAANGLFPSGQQYGQIIFNHTSPDSMPYKFKNPNTDYLTAYSIKGDYVSVLAAAGATELSINNIYKGSTTIKPEASLIIPVNGIAPDSDFVIDGSLKIVSAIQETPSLSLPPISAINMRSIKGSGNLFIADLGISEAVPLKFTMLENQEWSGTIAQAPDLSSADSDVLKSANISVKINGNFIWSGSSYYSGETTIESGKTLLKSLNAIPANTKTLLIKSGATLDTSAVPAGSANDPVVLNNITVEGELVIGQAGVKLTGKNYNNSHSVKSISGNGSVIIAGQYTYLGTNTYTGSTTVLQKIEGYDQDGDIVSDDSLLIIDTYNALPEKTTLNVYGSIDIKSSNTIGGLNGNGIIDILDQSAQLTINGGGEFYGEIRSNGIINASPKIGQKLVFKKIALNNELNLLIAGEGDVLFQNTDLQLATIAVQKGGTLSVEYDTYNSIKDLTVYADGIYVINSQLAIPQYIGMVYFENGAKIKVSNISAGKISLEPVTIIQTKQGSEIAIDATKVIVIDDMDFIDVALLLSEDKKSLQLSFNVNKDAIVNSMKDDFDKDAIEILSSITSLDGSNEIAIAVLSKNADEIKLAVADIDRKSHAQVQDNILSAQSSALTSAFSRTSNRINSNNNGKSVKAMGFAPSRAFSREASEVGVWMRTVGSWGKVSSNTSSATSTLGFNHSTLGAFMGVDTIISGSNFLIGVVGGYSRGQVLSTVESSFKNPKERNYIDSYHFGAYGGTEMESMGVRFAFDGAIHDVSTMKSITQFSDKNGTYAGNYSAFSAAVMGEIAYIHRLASDKVEFFLQGLGSYSSVSGFQESGPSSALSASVGNTDSNALLSTIGMRAEFAISKKPNDNTRLRAEIGWQHDYSDHKGVPVTIDNGAIKFNTSTDKVADLMVTSIGVIIPLGTEGAILDVGYSGRYARLLHDHVLSLDLRMKM